MPDQVLSFLIDQNIPYDVVEWLRDLKPEWKITHVRDIGYEGKDDDKLYRWALENQAIIITFDEDFADARFYPIGKHFGLYVYEFGLQLLTM